MKRSAKLSPHEMSIEQLSLFNSGYAYADGYDRAICTCGWKSAPIQRSPSTLVTLFGIHSQAEAARRLKGGRNG